MLKLYYISAHFFTITVMLYTYHWMLRDKIFKYFTDDKKNHVSNKMENRASSCCKTKLKTCFSFGRAFEFFSVKNSQILAGGIRPKGFDVSIVYAVKKTHTKQESSVHSWIVNLSTKMIPYLLPSYKKHRTHPVRRQIYVLCDN